jgi:hypothetical protein
VNSSNFCKIYKQVLVFILLLPPLCFSIAPPTTHHRRSPQLPAAPSSVFLRHLAPSSPARRLTEPAGSSSHGRVVPLAARVAMHAVDRQQLLAACPLPLFSLGTCSVNFFFLLYPRAHRIPVLLPARLLRRSSSVHRRQLSPPLLLSNFVLH